jgi:mono/diheme cytochrome c family protein
MGRRVTWWLVSCAAVAAIVVAVPVALGATGKSSTPGDATAGKQIYVAFCGKCHTLSAAGSKGTLGPNLDNDKINFNCVVSAVEQGVGGIQAEYILRFITFNQVYDVAKYVMSARQKGGTSGESCGINTN